MELAAGCEQAPHWPRTVYEELVAPSGSVRRFAFIAEDAQILAGFTVAAWLPLEAEAEVENVVVAPACRRQGVGTGLLRRAMLAATEAGAAAIRLEVRASNAPAIALYQQNGFALTGTRRNYYCAPVEDAVLLRASLSAVRSQTPL